MPRSSSSSAPKRIACWSHTTATLMPGHFIEFIRDHDSPGIFIVSRKLPIGKAAEWLVLYWETSEAELEFP